MTNLQRGLIGLAIGALLMGALTLASRSRQAEHPAKTISFETQEATWMSVDVSPDGEWIAFDLLGDLYLLPRSGGDATSLTSGTEWDTTPRFSPDGKQLAFVSDRGGEPDIWILDLASRSMRQVTHVEGDTQGLGIHEGPEWLPGGREIAYVWRSNKYEVRIVSLDGASSISILSRGPFDSVTSIAASPRERLIVAAAGSQPDLSRLYEEGVRYELLSYDLSSQREHPLRDSKGSAVEGHRPRLSPNGRYVAYERRLSHREGELRLFDLVTSEDRAIAPLGELAAATFSDTTSPERLPGYAFTPDGRQIVIWDEGRLRRIALADGRAEVIPFNVRVVRELAEPIRGKRRVEDGELQVRAIRWPQLSPDGRSIVFSAIGHLWTAPVNGEPPGRLTTSDDFEYMPSFSPDGRRLAYVAIPYSARGSRALPRLMVMDLDSGVSQQLGTDQGDYLPSWAPDGSKLAVIRQSHASDGSPPRAQYGWVDVRSGRFHAVADAESFHHADFRKGFRSPLNQHVRFSSDGRHLLYLRGGLKSHSPDDPQPKLTLMSVQLDGQGAQEVLVSDTDVDSILASPDLSAALVLGRNHEAHVLPLDLQDRERVHIDLSKATRIADAVTSAAWADSRTIIYGDLNRIYSYTLGSSGPRLLEQIDLVTPRRAGNDAFAVRNARIITMDGETGAGRIIEQGVIVVRGQRISAIGPGEAIRVPDDAVVIDGSGLTIMPGLVDVHSHSLTESSRPLAIPEEIHRSGADLAYGITTALDAGGLADDGPLSMIELIESGRLLGPRWFSTLQAVNYDTGWHPWEIRRPSSREDAARRVARQVSLGASHSIKIRAQSHRLHSQWFAEAARVSGVTATAHVGTFNELLNRSAAGMAVDHASMVYPLYGDVTRFLAESRAVWTANVSSAMDMHCFLASLPSDIQRRELDKAKRLALEFVEESRLSHAQCEPSLSYFLAQSAAAITREGGRIALGVDGNPPIMDHSEMALLAKAGMSVGDVLRAATLNGAIKLGIDADTGSLEVGKLADFLVLARNPLEAIENTISVKWTVVGGAIYDAARLEVVEAGDTQRFRDRSER